MGTAQIPVRRSLAWLWLRWLYRRLRAALSRVIDQALGVRTTMDMPAAPFEDQPEQFTLKAWGWLPLYRVFRWLEVGPDDVMVDIGSGAGRAVLVASLFPFRRVVGLELLESQYRLAQENLARLRLRPRAPVELFLRDATDYELADEVTVIFFANPFQGPRFQRFMEGVFASFDRSPRRLRLVYCNPVEEAYLAKTGRCHLLKRFRGLRPTSEWARSLTTHIYVIGAGPTRLEGEAEVQSVRPGSPVV